MPGKPDSAPTKRPSDNSSAMSGAAILVQCLIEQGVEYVFGYPGGAVLPIYDELFGDERIRHILVRHEQAATHAAEGYARSTGKPGVVLVTSGPGATNAVTGITDALMDSIPMVVISGQVPVPAIGQDASAQIVAAGVEIISQAGVRSLRRLPHDPAIGTVKHQWRSILTLMHRRKPAAGAHC